MMQSFLFIFINIILPIFIQISSGYLIQKKFSLNIGSLSKIQFFIFLPSLLFVKIYETTLGKEIVTTVILHSLGIFVFLFFISWLLVRVSKHSTSVSKAFINSICFYNGGNYCLPIIQLLYNSSLAISIQVIIIMVQNILSNTVGIFNASSGKSDKRQALLNILKLPILYAIFLAIIMKLLGLKPWEPLWNSVNLLGQGMVPLALVILGAQPAIAGAAAQA